MKASSAEGHAGTGVVDGAIFALLGLLMAFAFSRAAARFDTRRELIVQEANAIGTAYLRVDLLAPEAQTELRKLFRDYLDTRMEAYERLPWIAGSAPEYDRSEQLLRDIWQRSVHSVGTASHTTSTLLLSALNEMIDITTVRAVAIHTHAPMIVFVLLIALAMAAAVLAGAGMAGSGRREWLHMLFFAVTMAATMYLIMDLDAPRNGLIRVDNYDHVLFDLRSSMK